MGKQNLLFYKEYEGFYQMAGESELFSRYCEKVYGKDFSQDGFSDVSQIDDILARVDLKEDQVVLDIGCGNGKMLKYIHEKTGAKAYGFDYSENAIASANNMLEADSQAFHFDVGLIGEMQYDRNKFDLITSIDTIYFTDDMASFVKQAMRWLKLGGYFVCAYQEGDLMPKTGGIYDTELAKVFRMLSIPYKALDYTKRVFDLLRHKRQVLESMKQDFLDYKLSVWYDCAYHQSIDPDTQFEDFIKNNSRYIYVVKK